MRWRPGDRQVLHRAAQEKIALPLLLTVCRHDIHEGATDPVLERWSDLPVRQGIAKGDHVLYIDALPYRLRHRHGGVPIRELARLQKLSQTHDDERTCAECRQRGGDMLSVKGTETFRQAYCRLCRRGAVLQGDLPRRAAQERALST